MAIFYWGEPHSNVENGMLVHAQRTMANNRIAVHYYSLVWWFMYKQAQYTYGYFRTFALKCKNKTPGYITKKVSKWSPCIMQVKFYLQRAAHTQFMMS